VETISNIIEQWKAEKIQLNPPATPGAIQHVEAITGYIFPPDFKDVYLITDGFKEWDWTPNMFSLWPLQRIIDEYLDQKSRSNNSPYEQQLADFLINSHQIGFLRNRTGVYTSYNEFNPIAHSFSETLEFINNDAL
jgi:hypothetical protein